MSNLGVICPLICILISDLRLRDAMSVVVTPRIRCSFSLFSRWRNKSWCRTKTSEYRCYCCSSMKRVSFCCWRDHFSDTWLWSDLYDFRSLKSFTTAVMKPGATMNALLDACPWHVTERLLCVYSLLPGFIQASRLHNEFTDPKNSLNSLTPQPI